MRIHLNGVVPMNCRGGWVGRLLPKRPWLSGCQGDKLGGHVGRKEVFVDSELVQTGQNSIHQDRK